MLRPLALAATALLTGAAARGVPTSLGAGSSALRAVADRSPHAVDGTFRNRQPGAAVAPGATTLARALLTRGRTGRPARPVPLEATPPPAAAGALAVTWFGHSSVLVEIDGLRVLADPVWGERVSPSPHVGPRRMHPVPLPLTALPAVDAVVISHDHYDHLDLPTVRALLPLGEAPFVVPLGVGAHLREWGVPDERVIELDWNGSATVTTAAGAVTLTCTEARHFSGRGVTRNTTLWSSWAMAGPRHRAFFGGDTGFHDGFAAIGERLGPFDLTVLPVGAYSDHWPDVHMTPEEAVRAHRALAAAEGLLVPVHWATFNLGLHEWAEPVERLRAAADGIHLAVPRPGERVDVTAPPPVRDWWSPIA